MSRNRMSELSSDGNTNNNNRQTASMISLSKDQLSYYEELFVEKKINLRASIIKHRYNDEQSKRFTEYTIRVEFGQNTYEISKRYSQFLVLKLEPKIDRSIIAVFPPKKFFGNQDIVLIESRMNSFNFHHQFSSTNARSSMGLNHGHSQMNPQMSVVNNGNGMASDQIQIAEIEEMLQLLNNNTDEQIQNYRIIEDRYGKQKPKLSPKCIRLLMLGNDKYKGLVKIVGQLNNEDQPMPQRNNHIQCSAGLQLLSKLLDIEFNRDADNYIQVFTRETPVFTFPELKLETHISDMPANNCRQYAFTLMKKYADRHAEKDIEKLKKTFEISQQSFDEYLKWIHQRSKGTANQFINLSVNKPEFRQFRDFRSSSNNNNNQNFDIQSRFQDLQAKKWVPIKKDTSISKLIFIKLGKNSGSGLFKITSYFSCQKNHMIDFFLSNLHIWDIRCISFRELGAEDVLNAEDLPIYSENYESRNKHVFFLYKFEKLEAEDGKAIYLFKNRVDRGQVKRHIFQASENLAEWKVYYKFSDCTKKNMPQVKCKVVQIIEHSSDHFFLSEMTGDTNDTLSNLINLQKHVNSKFSK